MLLDEYQVSAARTDVSSSEASQRHLILGLFGEAGSVLSVSKKKGRDKSSSLVYFAQSSEELGDLLWYLATAAKRSKLSLGQIAKPLVLQGSRRKKASELTFSDLQEPRKSVALEPTGHLEWVLMYLAEAVGSLITAQRQYVRLSHKPTLYSAYTKVLRRMVDVANRVGLTLDAVAKANLAKTSDRWPEDRQHGFPASFDSTFPRYERLPRKISFDIREVKYDEDDYFVYQSCGKVHIGDRLTDNIEYSDDYRFHDVFHYAYAAVIGWSPVLRAILKVKRKSVKEFDHNQDGARAILIEEGLAALIYNEAKQEGGLFGDVERGKLSFDLLKTIRSFVQGYEVKDVPYWVWEEAILQGFEAFRYLVEHRKGRVTIDYANRRLEVGPIPLPLRAVRKKQ
jgi:NTP pyrophosphatase (non-canonical NTP hydrolase)